MTDDAREGLILRHLDGETTPQEVAQVTRLLAQDETFRSRFFSCATLITELQEVLSMVKSEPAQPRVVPKGSAAAALGLPKAPSGAPDKPADGLSATIDLRQIYFNAILGSAGGLCGWFAMMVAFAILPLNAIVTALMPTHFMEVLLKDAIIGLFVGVAIGFAVGSV